MTGFRVDPEHLTTTAGNLRSASSRMGALKDMLESVNGRLQSSSTMSQDTDADNKINDFGDRWKDEFGIIGDMLGKFDEALTSAADAYAGADAEFARGLREGGNSGGSDTGGDPSRRAV